jgi:hypothetical protein
LVHATDRAADGRRFEDHRRRAEIYRNFAEVPYCYLGTLFFGGLRVGRTLGFTLHILPVSGRATVGSICFYIAGGDLVRGFAFIADNVFARIARLRRSGDRFPPLSNKCFASSGNKQDQQEQDNEDRQDPPHYIYAASGFLPSLHRFSPLTSTPLPILTGQAPSPCATCWHTPRWCKPFSSRAWRGVYPSCPGRKQQASPGL